MNRFFLAGALAGVLCLQSCTDDDLLNKPGNGIPATPGTPVTFEAGLEPEEPATRTIYGDRNGNVFPIYWSHPNDEIGSKTYDNIYIFSATGNGSGGQRYARYSVLPASPKFEGIAPVRIVGDENNAIVVAESGEQDIFAFYPYDAVDISSISSNATGPYIYVNMPINQRVHVPPTDKENVHYAECDMNLCYMKAGGTFTLEENKAVQLQFKPWSSVLDITIPGPESGEACIVTDVTVKSTAIRQGAFTSSSSKYTQAPIAGRTYMYLNDSKTVGFTDGFDQTSCSEIINVDVCQEGSQEKGFRLESGKKLNLRVFLSPSASVKALDIEVHTADGFTEGDAMRLPTSPKVWVKRLEVENLSDALLAQGQIHPVIMPSIGSKDSGVSDLSQWMSELPDNAKITNLSIPGAYAAEDFFIQNYNDAKEYVGQTEDIASQFNAGIRAFNLHLDARYGAADPILGSGEMVLTLPYAIGTFGDFLSRLADVLKARNTEFCIVEVNLNQQSQNYIFLLNLFARYCKRLDEAGLLPKKKDEGYTVGDLRGKMLLQVKLDGDPKLLQQTGEYIERRWNYGFDYANNGTTDGFSPEDISMISPLSNIERLFLNTESTTIYSWDTYPDDTPFTGDNAEKWFENATPTVAYMRAPFQWQNIANVTGECPPVMLSYYTTTNWVRATLTPVAFGKIGDLQYTPRYPDEQSYLARPSGLTADEGFERTAQNAPVFSEYDRNSSSTSQAYKKETAGIRWMHAYVLWKNMEHTGTSQGMLYDNICRTYTDLRLSEFVRTDNQYVMFRDNPDQSYWLHQSDNWNEKPTYDKRSVINEGMWKSCPQFATVSNGAYANRSMVDVFTDLFPGKVFISTWLGLGWRYWSDLFDTKHDYNDNRKIVNDWLGYVTTNSSADELTINATYSNKPLGAVYMPYVPNRLTVLDETGLADGLDKERCLVGKDVRKIINMLIKHSKELN